MREQPHGEFRRFAAERAWTNAGSVPERKRYSLA
jgi:hypothetical protein